MPTAGRLAGGVAFLLLGLYIANLAVPNFEEGKLPSWWFPLAGGVGLWTGWVVVGSRTGNGWAAGFANGLTGAVTLVFWVMFLFSFVDMIKKSMRNSYDGPMDAIVNVFELFFKHVRELADVNLIVSLVVGGIIAGLFAEFFGKRYT